MSRSWKGKREERRKEKKKKGKVEEILEEKEFHVYLGGSRLL